MLLVEDDPALRRAVARGLQGEGFEVDPSADGQDAIDRFDPACHDGVIVDLLMPRASGMSVLRAVLERADVPVIVLSGHGDDTNRVLALELGAADFVAKPVTARELAIRLRNAFGRAATVSPSVLTFDGLEIDLAHRRVLLEGHPVDLTGMELDLLAFLARTPGKVFSRADLLRGVWGSNVGWQSPATVTEHIYRIRRKLEPGPDSPRWIHTVRGNGYRFAG